MRSVKPQYPESCSTITYLSSQLEKTHLSFRSQEVRGVVRSSRAVLSATQGAASARATVACPHCSRPYSLAGIKRHIFYCQRLQQTNNQVRSHQSDSD